MKLFTSWIAAAACVVSLSSLWAADPPPRNKLILEAGKTPEVVFVDGRITELYINRREPLVTTMPIKVTDNACTTPSNIACDYRTSLILDDLVMIWKANPDPTKVGKLVMAKFSQGGGQPPIEFPLYQQGLVAFSDHGMMPILSANLPNDIFLCKDFTWLPSGTVAAPDTVNLSRWDVEMMMSNPETGLMENRTISMAMDVTLKKNAEGGLEIGKVKKFLVSSQSVINATLWALITKNANGDYCPITIQPNSQAINNAITQYQALPPHYAGYQYGVDEFSNVAKPFFLDENIFNAPGVEFN